MTIFFIRLIVFSIVFGLLLIPFDLILSQTICAGIILGLFLAVITTFEK